MFPVFWNHLTILGTSMGSPDDFSAMLEFVGGQKLRPVVDRVFTMDDAIAAFEHLDRSEQFGKVVLAIAE